MSSTSQPFGLRPAYSPSGIVRPVAMSIVTGYTSNILQNQPVKIDTDGYIAAAAVNDRFVGTFQGVEFTDSDGRRRVSNKWTANTAATDIVAYVTTDPTMVYEIQTNAAVAIGDIGKQYDFTTVGAGSTTTGLSAMMLGVSTSAANAAFQLLNIAPALDNAWGDTFVIVQVRIAEHQLVADVAAF
jgi:hypothetical protein